MRTIHPFPARMAPDIPERKLPNDGHIYRVLDPMMGSGTTLVAARRMGHQAYGVDRDPLAVLITRSAASAFEPKGLLDMGEKVLVDAHARYRDISLERDVPVNCSPDTAAFIRFWFDELNRTQLTALSEAIGNVEDAVLKDLLWVAFSRMIITKKIGVSLAADVSHSRPHRVYNEAPITAFEMFPKASRAVVRGAVFNRNWADAPLVQVLRGDARELSIPDEFIDVVITSPPYLNGIDYMRGHKLSLVWMGHDVTSLTNIRADNIGTESIGKVEVRELESVLGRMGNIEKLPLKVIGMISRYVNDMSAVIREIRRVLVKNGRAVIVCGDSTLKGVFIQNSEAIAALGPKWGLRILSREHRRIPANRRYLPPPSSENAGFQLEKRLRTEVVLTMAVG